MGETDRFIIDCNGANRLIRVYGKELPSGAPFKLSLTLSQTADVLFMLTRARNAMQGTQKVKIGEKNGYVVYYDGKLVTLFRKENRVGCPFKLAFDKGEIAKVTYLLRKTRNFF